MIEAVPEAKARRGLVACSEPPGAALRLEGDRASQEGPSLSSVALPLTEEAGRLSSVALPLTEEAGRLTSVALPPTEEGRLPSEEG